MACAKVVPSNNVHNIFFPHKLSCFANKGKDSRQKQKKSQKIIWKVFIKTLIFAAFSEENTKKFGLWCNGSTTGFGSVCPGSNPGSPTTIQLIAAKNPLKSQVLVGFLLFFPLLLAL